MIKQVNHNDLKNQRSINHIRFITDFAVPNKVNS